MQAVTLFLCGDVMTGRGVDQILPHRSRPELFEPYVRSALEYVGMAERKNGTIPKPAPFSYVWGEALKEWERRRPAARIVNLETAVTSSDAYVPKGINYRMHPANAPCLSAAKIDCSVLANNHILDWGRQGLAETLATLHSRGIRTAGAGLDREQAFAPAVIPAPGVRILVFAAGTCDSGIPIDWQASEGRPGVALLPDLSRRSAEDLGRRITETKQPGDLVVLSLHWGGNWGYGISPDHREFAHTVLDVGGVDLIHGHSAHHPKGIEVHHGKLILYGCGDFLNDYEGISGYEEFRGDLTLMYWPTLDASTGRLICLEMTPLRIRRFRLERAMPHEAQWLAGALNRASEPVGSRVAAETPDRLRLVVPEVHEALAVEPTLD